MSSVRITRAGLIAMAVAWAGVKPVTVRKWISRGHITAHPDGFDPDELAIWLETIRCDGKAIGGAHAAHVRHQTRRSA